MAKVTGGEAVVKALLAQGVDTIFGLPGVQNDWLFNALYDHRDQIKVIHPRHEQGAGYMALGYAQASGKVGVCSVVPGPGFLNAASALATAYSLNAKVLCLVGQLRLDQINRGYGMLHEIPNQLEILKTLTKWAERANAPAEVPGLVAEAFKQMGSGRPRPVGLEVPPDVLAQQAEVDLTPPVQDHRHPPLDSEAIEAAAKLLGQAKNPMIYVGSGAVEVAPEINQLAETLQAPVTAGRSGLGIVDSRHYLSINSPAAHTLWPQVDVVLAVGTRMQAPQMSWGLDDNIKVIRIELDPEEMIRFGEPAVGILARSQDALPALLSAVEKYNSVRASREGELRDLKLEVEGRLAALEPQISYLKAIRQALPEDGLFVDDLTQVGYVSRHALPVYRPRNFIAVGYQGTLGWSFATALGVKVAHPDKPVLAVAGDGGFMFTMPELATAVQHKISTVTIVFNDGAFGNVRRMQQNNYDGRLIATELQNPDFVKLAESFGAQGLRAETPEQLGPAISQGFAYTDGPTIIEVPVGEMPEPWSLWFLPRVRPA